MAAHLWTQRRWVRPRTTVLGAAIAGLVVATVPVSPVQSAPDQSCPRAIRVSDLTKDMPVHGLTVTSGTTPDSFGGKVLGVLQDGIAPGLDMIMVKLNGSEITDANGNVDKGIWAGMSGSPVYTDDGRLIGAVAYGLSFSPSDVAGVTPGAEMRELLDAQPASPALKAAASATRVAIPGPLADRLVSSGAMSTAQADSGFKRLPMPFSVSGLSNRHLRKAANGFDINRPLVTGGKTSAAAPATEIVPGGNLAASLSYGDITYAGTGTATAVCGDETLAFGHPLLWSGNGRLSMHGADAIYIQKDTVFGSFKVANPSAPVGQIVDDRLAGIHGIMNQFPRSTEVTSRVEATNGNSRRGETVVTFRRATPFLSAIHLLANADRVLDEIGGGTASVRWTFEGTRADGRSWTFTRGDRFASSRDITFASIFESYAQMSQILHNRFERVEITDVHYKASYSPKYDALKIAKLEIKPADRWITVSRRHSETVSAGTDLPVRLTLTPSNGIGDNTVVKLSVRIPKSAREGVLFVTGGADGGRGGPRATSFDDLLVELARAPRNSEVTATLRTESKGRGGTQDSDSRNVGEVVSGYKYVRLDVR